MSDPRLDVFVTPRDWFRYAVGRFRSAALAFGHGTTNAVDEAAFLILEALHLPIDALDPFADAEGQAPQRLVARGADFEAICPFSRSRDSANASRSLGVARSAG